MILNKLVCLTKFAERNFVMRIKVSLFLVHSVYLKVHHKSEDFMLL